MSEGNKKKRGNGKTRGSQNDSGRGYTALGGGSAGRRNGNNHHRQKVPDGSNLSEVLAFGLSIVGFGEGQQTCGKSLCESRFRSHYRPCPRAVKFLITLMKTYQPDEKIDLYLLFMALCWLCLSTPSM